jgi:L-alanine-DL-glutamate epimerase-like enolase superfamily enzyme
LEDLEFVWFEAPLPDHDIEGYRELTSRVNIPVIPSGNWIQDLPSLAEGLRTRAWGAARLDATILGGITPARKAIAMVDAAEMKCEVMSWGFSLISAANLHLMLAFDNCTFFEQTMPYEPYECGMKEVIRTQADGYVYAPEGPGLGLEVDWEAMQAATIHSVDSGKGAQPR